MLGAVGLAFGVIFCSESGGAASRILLPGRVALGGYVLWVFNLTGIPKAHPHPPLLKQWE
jgi:hypothetical protein